MNKAKNLKKEPPVSPRQRLAGFALLPRTIEKCRALLWGEIGEYHYDCPFDKVLFSWKGINAADLKLYIAEGHTDEEIGAWVKATGVPKTDSEIKAWSDQLEKYRLAGDSTKWLEGENKRLGLPASATLMDMLEADDKASFKK